MTSLHALLRQPTISYSRCISNHPNRSTINVYKALEQHHNYGEHLKKLGCKIHMLPPLNSFPDSCFVEDRCVVAGNTAVMCRANVRSRLGEEVTVAGAILRYKQTTYIEKPAHVDGGDIIIVGDHIYGGVSKRTNLKALKQLAKILNKKLTAIQIPKDVLHLKTISTYVGFDTVLVREDLAHLWKNTGYNIVGVPMAEAPAANCIAMGDKVIVPSDSPKTVVSLSKIGFNTILIADMSEFQKGDGSLTCLSIIFESGK